MMLRDPGPSFGTAAGDIAFSDVVFNLFAVLVLLLLLLTPAIASLDAVTDTSERKAVPLVPVRSCHVEARRPVSLFIHYGADTLHIVDHDAVARALVARPGKTVAVGAGYATLGIDPDGADANGYDLLYKPQFPEGTPPKPGDRITDDIAFLEQRVYARGYIPYFEVLPKHVAAFAPLHRHLIDEGGRFRWRLARRGEPLQRFRDATAFDAVDFCR